MVSLNCFVRCIVVPNGYTGRWSQRLAITAKGKAWYLFKNSDKGVSFRETLTGLYWVVRIKCATNKNNEKRKSRKRNTLLFRDKRKACVVGVWQYLTKWHRVQTDHKSCLSVSREDTLESMASSIHWLYNFHSWAQTDLACTGFIFLCTKD